MATGPEYTTEFLWGERSSEHTRLGGAPSLFCAKCDDVLTVLPLMKLLPSCSSDYSAAHLTKLQWCNEAVGKSCGKNTDLLIWESMHILPKKISDEKNVFIALQEFLHYLKITHKLEACCLALKAASPQSTFVRAHSQFH